MHILCGCREVTLNVPNNLFHSPRYLPLVRLSSHTTILTTTARTVLTQNYVNDSSHPITECQYDFPLYDGVSVVGFTCQVGLRTIKGIVQEKGKAEALYHDAVSKGETAGLLSQGTTADVFTTRLGNVPSGEALIVTVTYIGELKHDVGAASIRFTIPTNIAPRYGNSEALSRGPQGTAIAQGESISITVDIDMAKGSFIREVRSPSHPIAVTLGNTAHASSSEDLVASRASASLSQNNSVLDKDFVLEILNSASTSPKAVLEEYTGDATDRALMVTLVPSFNLPSAKPEVILVADRSGSMNMKIPTLIRALKIFLRSLPVGICFNICSFGSSHTFLWPSSQLYDERSLDEATQHVESFSANYGGTETLAALRGSIERRDPYQDLTLILLTDGDIWQQQTVFDYLNHSLQASKKTIRVFPLGIGDSVSSGFIEGVARAGKGFASVVGENEKMDAKLIRMLKGALIENVTDYTLEVNFEPDKQEDDDFVLVERVVDSLENVTLDDAIGVKTTHSKSREGAHLETNRGQLGKADISGEPVSKSDGHRVPVVSVPKLLQTPQEILPLYPSARTTVYLIMSPETPQRKPTAVILRGSTSQGPLEVSIPVECLADSGETIHQLAARKAVSELEEGRGWLTLAKDRDGALLKQRYSYQSEEVSTGFTPFNSATTESRKVKKSQFQEMVEREAVRLGVQYQIGGKWCSFVAVEGDQQSVQAGNSYARVSGTTTGNPSTQSSSLFGAARGGVRASAQSSSGLFGSGNYCSAAVQPSSGVFGDSNSLTAAAQPPFGLFGARGSRSQAHALLAPSPNSIFGAPAAGQSRSGRGGSKNFSMAPQDLSTRSSGVSNINPPADDEDDSTEFDEIDPEEQMRGRAPSSTASLFGNVTPNAQALSSFRVQQADPLDQIISLQQFQGCWEWTQALLNACGVFGGSITDTMHADNSTSEPSRKTVWATILAVVFLERKMAAEADAWELVVDKAKSFLQQIGVNMQVEMGKSPLKELIEGL